MMLPVSPVDLSIFNLVLHNFTKGFPGGNKIVTTTWPSDVIPPQSKLCDQTCNHPDLIFLIAIPIDQLYQVPKISKKFTIPFMLQQDETSSDQSPSQSLHVNIFQLSLNNLF